MAVTPDYQQLQPLSTPFLPHPSGCLLTVGHATQHGCVSSANLSVEFEWECGRAWKVCKGLDLRTQPGGWRKVTAMPMRISKSDRTPCCSYKDECPCSDGVESWAEVTRRHPGRGCGVLRLRNGSGKCKCDASVDRTGKSVAGWAPRDRWPRCRARTTPGVFHDYWCVSGSDQLIREAAANSYGWAAV